MPLAAFKGSGDRYLNHLYTIEKTERIRNLSPDPTLNQCTCPHDPFHCLNIDNILDNNSFAAMAATAQEYHFWVLLITCAFLNVVLHNIKCFMHLTRHRKGTINHENEHNVATILAYYPPDSTIYSKRSIHPPSWRIDPCYSREVRVNK